MPYSTMPVSRLCGIQTVEHRFDGGLSAQAVDHVEARAEADLGVDDALGCEVDARFVGRSSGSRPRLHITATVCSNASRYRSSDPERP